MSDRLSDFLRKKIAAELVGGKFDVEYDTLYRRSASLAENCYQHFYSTIERGAYKRMLEIPEGWLPEYDKITVQFGDAKITQGMHFNGLSRFLPWSGDPSKYPNLKKKFRQVDLYTSPLLVLPKGHELSKEFFTLSSLGADLKKRQGVLDVEVKTVLNSVTTSKRLIEIWPEVEPIVVKLMPVQTKHGLPAVVLKNLNVKLGLNKAA